VLWRCWLGETKGIRPIKTSALKHRETCIVSGRGMDRWTPWTTIGGFLGWAAAPQCLRPRGYWGLPQESKIGRASKTKTNRETGIKRHFVASNFGPSRFRSSPSKTDSWLRLCGEPHQPTKSRKSFGLSCKNVQGKENWRWWRMGHLAGPGLPRKTMCVYLLNYKTLYQSINLILTGPI